MNKVEEPEISGQFEGYDCGRCGRGLRVFVCHGIRGQEAEKFTKIDVYPCLFCAETNQFEGMKFMMERLIDGRE